MFESKVYKQRIYANSEDYIIRKSVLVDELWEYDLCLEMSIVLDKRGGDFLDIGANIGLSTLGTRLLTRNKFTSHCIEMNSRIFESLRMNTKTHPNIRIYNFGVGLACGLENMCYNEYNNGATSIDYKSSDRKIFYSIKKLDCVRDYFKNISVVKIDIEGYEYKALYGMSEFLKEQKPDIFIEIFPDKFNDVNRILSSYDYELKDKYPDFNYHFRHRSRAFE